MPPSQDPQRYQPQPPNPPAYPPVQPGPQPAAPPSLQPPAPGYPAQQPPAGAYNRPLDQPTPQPSGQPSSQPPQAPAYPPYQPTPAADSQARYDFFMNPAQPAPKKRLTPLKGRSSFSKILLLGGGFMVLLIVLAVILSVSRSGSDNTPVLSAVASSQQEIIRVSTLGTTKVSSQSLKNFSATALSTTTTAQQEYLKFLATVGVKSDAKQLALTQNTKVDAALDAAEAASTYDTTYKATMESLLQDYETKLVSADRTVSQPTTKALLARQYAAAKLLEQQLEQ